MGDERSAGVLDKHLGQRLRTRRLQIGMSQERLAAILGVTFQQVQKYERGVNRIAARRLFDIAEALDMPAAGFFENFASGRGGAQAKGASAQDVLATPDGVQLVKLFSAIKSKKLRRRVLEVVRSLVEGDERQK